MAVSEAAVNETLPQIPQQSHPLVGRDGRIDPIWHRYFVERDKTIREIITLINALRNEVNTQHP